MMGRTLAPLLVLAVSATAYAAPFAYVANNFADTVSRIDLASHEAVAIPTAPEPRSVAVNPSGTRAYVSTLGGGIVTVIDGEHAGALHDVDVGGAPREIAVSLSGARAWVGNDEGRIDVVDGVTGTVATSIPVPFTNFYAADTNPAGTRAYFAAADFAAQMIVVDTATDAIVTNTVISTLAPPTAIAVDPSGTRVYVTLEYAGAVVVVDAVTNLVLETIPLGCTPECPEVRGITVSPDGETVYVAAFRPGGVIVLDAATLTEVDFIETGGLPSGIDVTPDGAKLYVTDVGNDTLSVIDTASRSIVGTLAGFSGVSALGTFIGGGVPTPPSDPPVLDAAARKCQTAVGAGFPKLAGKAHKLIAGCLDDVQRDRALGAVTASTATGCARSLDLADPTSKLSRLRAAEVTKLVAKCGAVPVIALGPPCDDDVTTVTELAQCVTGRQLDVTGRAIAAAYAGACALLAEVSLDDTVPGVCE